LDPREVLEDLLSRSPVAGRTVSWAVGDIEDSEAVAFDLPSTCSEENTRRIAWLFENDEYDLPNLHRPACHRNNSHTYRSVYGRLRWDQPAQTITTGFGSMGQGRYVHPSRRRTITPHEAARLQGLPDFFSFASTTKRSAWSRLIGNAVPPFLTTRIAELLLGG